MMRKEATFGKQSRLLLDEAFDAFDKGDLRQASNKGWGAAAQMVKAVAQQLGWEHKNDRDLYAVVSKLRLETRSPELTSLFGAATSLRLNASQSRLAIQDVEDNLRRVGKFISRLEDPHRDSPQMVTKKELAPPSKEQSRLYYEEARTELSKGYLVEASEKGWLAAFEMARFVGHHKGCAISDRRDFIRFISNQRIETGDSEWSTMMASAGNLDNNFHENWFDYEMVKYLLESVGSLMDRLEGLLDGTP